MLFWPLSSPNSALRVDRLAYPEYLHARFVPGRTSRESMTSASVKITGAQHDYMLIVSVKAISSSRSNHARANQSS